MKIFKTSLNIILSFVLIILIAINLLINMLENKILNKDYILSKMEETQIYLQISREVQSGFENYIYQSGLPEDIIKDLYTEEILKNDVNSFVNAIYDGTEIKISNDLVKQNLDNKINEYLVSQGKTLNEQGKKNIEKFEKLIVGEYKDNISIYKDVYELSHDAVEKISSIVDKIKILPMVFIAIVMIILIIINLKDLIQVINYVCISFLSLGILLKIGISMIFSKIDIDNIIMIAKSLSNLLINVVKEILYQFSDNATLFIVIGVSGIIISAVFGNDKTNNSKKEEKTKKVA